MSEERTCECVMDLRKYRGVAFVLAFALGPVTWLYTYKYDKWKYWFAFGLGLFFTLVVTPIMLVMGGVAGIFLSLAYMGVVWLWAIIDVLIKPSEFYDNYYMKR